MSLMSLEGGREGHVGRNVYIYTLLEFCSQVEGLSPERCRRSVDGVSAGLRVAQLSDSKQIRRPPQALHSVNCHRRRGGRRVRSGEGAGEGAGGE